MKNNSVIKKLQVKSHEFGVSHVQHAEDLNLSHHKLTFPVFELSVCKFNSEVIVLRNLGHYGFIPLVNGFIFFLANSV